MTMKCDPCLRFRASLGKKREAHHEIATLGVVVPGEARVYDWFRCYRVMNDVDDLRLNVAKAALFAARRAQK